MSRGNVLKIADYGLARGESEKDPKYSTTVFTLWYRPPEILLGIPKYGPAADIW